MGVLSILLIAAGAILTFAVNTTTESVDLQMVGVVLMIVGAIGLLVSLIRGSWMGFSSTRERTVSPDGRTVVERDRTSGI
jgi:predicted Na+-dependent transporter